MKKIILATAVIVVLGSCKKKEVDSCFETDTSEVLIGEIIQFTNCSQNTVETEWDFGDGTSSELQSPSHKYEESGEYIVTLTEFDKKGNTVMFEKLVKVANLKITKISIEGVTLSNDYYVVFYNQFGYMDENNVILDIENKYNSFTVDFIHPWLIENIESQFYILKYNRSVLTYDKSWFFEVNDEIDRESKQIILKDDNVKVTIDYVYSY